MIDNGKDKDILYATIVYGRNASVGSKFKDIPEKVKVKKLIHSLAWEDAGKQLDEALEETNKLFKEHGRPKSRKITVVFVTGTADATTSELKKAAKKLNDNEVKIIVVKMGTDPDDKQLEVITPKKNIVKVNESDEPEKSAKMVDDERMKGSGFVFKHLQLIAKILKNLYSFLKSTKTLDFLSFRSLLCKRLYVRGRMCG